MSQRSLFDPEGLAREKLHDAILSLDFNSAERKLWELKQYWPDATLSWEPELIRAGLKFARRRLNLDSGHQVWTKLEVQLSSLKVPKAYRTIIRSRFFSRLLAANRSLFQELRTPEGRSVGDCYLLADQPNNARRFFEREVKEYGDGWEQRLGLGNCDFRLGNHRAAHSNYRWSFLLGLPIEQWERIEDTGFLERLREVEDTEWAFPEMFIAESAPSQFSTRQEFQEFMARFMPSLTDAPPARRFCLYFLISENKAFLLEDDVMQARLQMKALNSRLHQRYMQRLP